MTHKMLLSTNNNVTKRRRHGRRSSGGAGFYFAALAALPCAGVALTQLPSSSSLAAPQQRLWPASQEASSLSWKTSYPMLSAESPDELASGVVASLYDSPSPPSSSSSSSSSSSFSSSSSSSSLASSAASSPPLLVTSPEIGALLGQEAGFQPPSQQQLLRQQQQQQQQQVSKEQQREELEAELRRTSKVAAFLAQDAVALSQELRGLETTLTRNGYLTDQQLGQPHQQLQQGDQQLASLYTSFVNTGIQRYYGRDPEASDVGAPQDAGGLDGEPSASLNKAEPSTAQEQPIAGSDAEMSSGDVVNPSNNDTEQVVSPAMETFDESQNGTDASGSTVVMARRLAQGAVGSLNQPALHSTGSSRWITILLCSGPSCIGRHSSASHSSVFGAAIVVATVEATATAADYDEAVW
eukprot:CAMPEP_0206544014 /NCGR_PEP_ID=MMETSP0325_2-20121206/11251_1 /ASSEMBLY_ACC=CAM_ASM_000347 /TAXON_ID=2866 /ORGANISM="Crypthecodinium cohnii, Strain Seligo" /LENGTH=410 /DNA_ID=CAMNT_0054042653 /DNA_START=57 /DNA_END=1287 /DNA_ORIENTATION=+